MNRYKLGLFFCFMMGNMTAQKPDFSLIGFGEAATGGGENGKVVPVSNLQELRSALLLTSPTIIEISDTIKGVFGSVSEEKDNNLLEVKSNKTIIGIGKNAFLSNIQLYLKNAQNIIVRNIKFSMIGSSLESDADMISIATTSSGECKNIWIDHCEFYNVTPTLPENAAKKDLYDGMIDIKKSSYNITISWNYFHDHWKCSLIGFTDTDTFDRKITYHHNYFRNIKSRVPSYRGGTGHIYNNYFEGLSGPNQPSSEGVNSREEACLKVEGNYFKDYKNTVYSAIADVVKLGNAYGTGNVFEHSPGITTNPCELTLPYTYTLDKAEDVPALLKEWAGVGKLGDVVNTSADLSTFKLTLNPTIVEEVTTLNLKSERSGTAKIWMMSINGKLMMEKKVNMQEGNNQFILEMDQYPPGIYIIHFEKNGFLKSQKLVKN